MKKSWSYTWVSMVFCPGVLQAVMQGKNGIVGVERDGLLVVVGDADRRLQPLPERYCAPAGVNRPLATVHQRIGVHELIRRVVSLAQHPDSQFDEQFARLRLAIVQSTVNRAKLLDRAGNRIGDHWIVVGKPDAKVSVPLKRQARDHPRPVESRCAVVTILRVGQVEYSVHFSVGDGSLGIACLQKGTAPRGRGLGRCRKNRSHQGEYRTYREFQWSRLCIADCISRYFSIAPQERLVFANPGIS